MVCFLYLFLQYWCHAWTLDHFVMRGLPLRGNGAKSWRRKFNLALICGCRADQHIPSYAKKLVSLYNENGEVDNILKQSSSWSTEMDSVTCSHGLESKALLFLVFFFICSACSIVTSLQVLAKLLKEFTIQFRSLLCKIWAKKNNKLLLDYLRCQRKINIAASTIICKQTSYNQ